MKNQKVVRRYLLIPLCFIGLLFVPGMLSSYDTHVVMLGLLTAIFALSLNFTLGYVGQPNFGQAALFGFGAYVGSIASTKLGLPFGVSLLASVIGSVVVGFFIGYISLQLRGAYFCMVTIAIGQVFLLLSGNLVKLTGGPMGITGVGGPQMFGLSERNTLWVLSILLLALTIWLTWKLERSVIGRAWVAIRESETLSLSLGIDAFRYALLAYIIGAIFAGATGAIYAHYLGFIDPTIFAFSWSSSAVVSVAIGGRGTILGPIIGGLMVTLLPEYFRVVALWRRPLFGLILILIIVFQPRGLIGLSTYIKGKSKELLKTLKEGRALL